MSSSTDRVVRELCYRELPGHRPLCLDLHLPAQDGAPVVVFLHGGGWRAGSRRTFVPGLSERESFGRLTLAGLAVAAVDYRLSGEARFPAQLDDVLAAIAWLRSSGPERGIDASRLVAWGESAGGHLAALAGLTPGSDLHGVVDWYGPSDLLAFPAPTAADERPTREEALIGGPIPELAGLARAASPVHRVRADSPPFHIAHGDADDLVPASQSVSLAEALRRIGASASLQIVPDAGHMWRGIDDPGVVFDPAIDFVRRVI